MRTVLAIIVCIAVRLVSSAADGCVPLNLVGTMMQARLKPDEKARQQLRSFVSSLDRNHDGCMDKDERASARKYAEEDTHHETLVRSSRYLLTEMDVNTDKWVTRVEFENWIATNVDREMASIVASTAFAQRDRIDETDLFDWISEFDKAGLLKNNESH